MKVTANFKIFGLLNAMGRDDCWSRQRVPQCQVHHLLKSQRTKHIGRRKAKKDLPHLGVKERELYVSKNYKHVTNTGLYKTRSKDSVELLVMKRMKSERSRKQIQFVLIFHLLAHGCLMLEYKACQSLFMFLRVPRLSKLHWSDNAG